MFTKTRGIVILLTILILAQPGFAQSPAADTVPSATTIANTELSAFIRAVIDVNPQVQAARATLDASWAYESAAGRPLYNPELELEAEDSDTRTRTLGISQTLDWGGKRRARMTVADAERRAVEAEFTSVRWQISVELLSALAQHQTESDRNALTQVRVAAMQEFASISQQRFDAGDISQIDLDLAILAYAQARMQQATSAASAAESRQAVVNLVFNVPENSWPRISEELPSTDVVTSGAADLVTALPHVRVARLQADAARARVSLRERERRTDPTLTLRGGKEDDETLVGVNLTIPLPVRNSFRHEVTAANAEHRRAQQVLSDISRRAHARFLGAQERFRISWGAWQDWSRTGEISLKSQGDLLRRLWETGELSTTDYLVQLKQTLDTSESALDLRRAMWRAWFEWMTASGQIKNWLETGA